MTSHFTHDPDEPDVELADVGLTEADVEQFVRDGREAAVRALWRELNAALDRLKDGTGTEAEYRVAWQRWETAAMAEDAPDATARIYDPDRWV